MQTRNDKRKGFTQVNRITLAEQDLDKHDGRFESISKLMTAILLLFVGVVLTAAAVVVTGAVG